MDSPTVHVHSPTIRESSAAAQGAGTYNSVLKQQAAALLKDVNAEGLRAVYSASGYLQGRSPFTHEQLDTVRQAERAGFLRDRPMVKIQVNDDYSGSRQFHHVGGRSEDVWDPFMNQLMIGKFADQSQFPVMADRTWWQK